MRIEGKFMLFSRDEFKEWLMKQSVKRQIHAVQNHHTYKPDYSNFNGKNHFALAKAMERYHIAEAKMSEIAQNFTTYNDGSIMLCRSLEKDPAGFKGSANNHGHITIEHLGNFDLGKDYMTEEHKKTIVFLNALLCIKFGIQPSVNAILYHHFVSSKSCPGTKFFEGNTKETADKFFIPLIKNAIKSENSPNTDQKPDIDKEQEAHKSAIPDTIKLGEKGNSVIKLQKLLNALGYKLQVDGVFGIDTKNSVIAFQEASGLSPDGIVGKMTWAKLLKLS